MHGHARASRPRKRRLVPRIRAIASEKVSAENVRQVVETSASVRYCLTLAEIVGLAQTDDPCKNSRKKWEPTATVAALPGT